MARCAVLSNSSRFLSASCASSRSGRNNFPWVMWRVVPLEFQTSSFVTVACTSPYRD
ncbi:hypothetical protein A2U01_0061813, partial [Trifolium medium]|nr:hypothetical protein [Trifolium medium]